MKLPRTRDCGELLAFEEIRTRLRLGRPQREGEATIRVDHVVGTVGRPADFDGCFRPRTKALAKRVDEIAAAKPEAVHEAIDVVRVDRAYFVVDGHKRMSIARRSGMEFIDAVVSSAQTDYELAPGVTADDIERTALERRFLEESGLAAAVPAARFPVTQVVGYPELRDALESYGFELLQRLGRVLSREEVAAMWYETVYRPTVQAAQRASLTRLLRCCTDADLFLALHKQSRRLWGTDGDVHAESGDELVARIRSMPLPDQSLIDRVVQRARRRRSAALLPQRGRDRPDPATRRPAAS